MDNQTPRSRFFVGMPGYGSLSAGAARGFWRATRNPNTVFHYQEGSLLAQNFNSLWVRALNYEPELTPNYFAMQHADIEPEDFWLDALVAELESNNLDVLGVVAPIKDHKGLTSIALGEPGEYWKPKCRLTMQEVLRLPETFTGDDIGHQLLLNTGLWVCRFDPAWASKVYFTINDRIAQDRTTGKYIAQVEPEDWFFSRLLHEQGLRIGATRKIRLLHRGEQQYANFRQWGQEFDSEYTSESLIHGSISFPHDIDGWLTEEEGRALAGLAGGKRVLEIGSWCGRSTVCLAQVARQVVAVDTWDGRGTPEPRSTREEFNNNLARYDVSGTVHPLDRDDFDSRLVAGQVAPFDLIFIDGDHEEEAVQTDIESALHCLKPDGLLVFHDYLEERQGVIQNIGRLVEMGGELLSVHNTLAVVRPPALTPTEI